MGLSVLSARLWADGVVPQGALEHVLAVGGYLWALPVLASLCSLAGFVMYGGLPTASRGGPLADPHPRPCPNLVCFRVISRGRNVAALRATVQSVREEMAALPLFRYRLEVVTDVPVELPPGEDLRALVVHPDYTTRNGSLYKARALQYAVEHSALPSDAWLFHLDEESQLSPSLVIGIRDAVVEEETSGRHRIGQGAILYHRQLRRHPFLTLADMVRTGDDLGRFRFQHRLGCTVFGLHGSFILVRNSIERQCDFDVGPAGSITEDAFWAVRQMARGNRSRWVDGFLLEQSTESAMDFVRQRRRWYTGLLRVVLYADTSLSVRLPLMLFIALWAVSWLGVPYLVVNLFVGLQIDPVVAGLGHLGIVTIAVTYLVGLTVNLRERPGLRLYERAGLYCALLLLLPAFSVLEAVGVVLAMVKPERGFHVVSKRGIRPPVALRPTPAARAAVAVG